MRYIAHAHNDNVRYIVCLRPDGKEKVIWVAEEVEVAERFRDWYVPDEVVNILNDLKYRVESYRELSEQEAFVSML